MNDKILFLRCLLVELKHLKLKIESDSNFILAQNFHDLPVFGTNDPEIEINFFAVTAIKIF